MSAATTSCGHFAAATVSGNQLSAGRHSLNTRDFEEAKDILHDFNLQVAVNLELASRRLLDSQSGKILSIKSGLERFMAVAPEME
jgi:hypothetical protein